MVKKEKYYSEEQQEIRSFVKILSILVIIFLGLYLLTSKVFDKKEPYKRTNNEGQVQYDEIAIGTLLNRADDEYYVLVYDSNKSEQIYLLNKASSYKSNENSLPLYMADLSLEFNKQFMGDVSNYKEDSIEDIKFKNVTLVKIKKGKIIKFIEDKDLIEQALS